MSAREKLKTAGKFDIETAKLCGQTTSKNLTRRRKDYDAMIKGAGNKNMSGYHMPGSLKK